MPGVRTFACPSVFQSIKEHRMDIISFLLFGAISSSISHDSLKLVCPSANTEV
jgi:hypothetical protein